MALCSVLCCPACLCRAVVDVCSALVSSPSFMNEHVLYIFSSVQGTGIEWKKALLILHFKKKDIILLFYDLYVTIFDCLGFIRLGIFLGSCVWKWKSSSHRRHSFSHPQRQRQRFLTVVCSQQWGRDKTPDSSSCGEEWYVTLGYHSSAQHFRDRNLIFGSLNFELISSLLLDIYSTQEEDSYNENSTSIDTHVFIFSSHFIPVFIIHIHIP